MHRRTLVKQLVLASGAYLLLPACSENKDRTTTQLKNIKLDADQEQMMAELAETILPATTTPGAKEINAPLFALLMIDDCMKKEDQEKFVKGLRDFSKESAKKMGKDFTEADVPARTALVLEEDGRKEDDSDRHFFYATVKRYTVQAYTTSQFFLTKVQKYELVPGRYHGCVPVKPAPTTTL